MHWISGNNDLSEGEYVIYALKDCCSSKRMRSKRYTTGSFMVCLYAEKFKSADLSLNGQMQEQPSSFAVRLIESAIWAYFRVYF